MSIGLEVVLKPFLNFWNTSQPKREPLSTNGEDMEQWWTFPGAASRAKWPHKGSDDTSQTISKNFRLDLPQLRSEVMLYNKKMTALKWQSSKTTAEQKEH